MSWPTRSHQPSHNLNFDLIIPTRQKIYNRALDVDFHLKHIPETTVRSTRCMNHLDFTPSQVCVYLTLKKKKKKKRETTAEPQASDFNKYVVHSPSTTHHLRWLPLRHGRHHHRLNRGRREALAHVRLPTLTTVSRPDDVAIPCIKAPPRSFAEPLTSPATNTALPCRVGNEIGVAPDVILETSHGRRSIDILKILAPEKANWECELCSDRFPLRPLASHPHPPTGRHHFPWFNHCLLLNRPPQRKQGVRERSMLTCFAYP